MKTETTEDVLAGSVRHVVDAESLKTWVDGPLQAVLPHRAMLCGQSVAHSGGYAAIQLWSFGVPSTYLAAIECAGGNLRSPIQTRLMRSGEPEYFAVDHVVPEIDGAWLASFRSTGWRNLLGLAHFEGEGQELLLTTAAFYDVKPVPESHRHFLQRKVMPHVHAALSGLRRGAAEAADWAAVLKALTPAEHAITGWVLQGKTNKEIGRLLCKSAETVKRQLALLMRRVGVRNRTELAHLLSLVDAGVNKISTVRQFPRSGH
ncbi:helix-turn-helix transcriptional regulator [Variovorax sp. PBL-E5]|uniref:helix-turn-helix transcriptional regulator n=1 Tax=Variovorax sp. PBL-E5 TaxID=434014 RepID=UPI0013194EE1|nr:helix-turn-helix transcriptional regulator [Variovorax sp. PBL-E5]VTU32458.1 transcriptional regulator EpsA [Variovorax sp. PBL-E5]